MVNARIKVFLTVDVEHSIGGAFHNPQLKPVGNKRHIYCEIKGKDYGISLIMDALEKNNLAATFFLEVMNKAYFGEEESKSVCQYILKRNHDVQLHVHPNYRYFTQGMTKPCSDLLADYSLDEQIEIIAEGISLLKKYGVSHPIAFRAGCFGANDNTLKAIRKNGLLFDSSYCLKFQGKTCFLNDFEAINDATEKDSVIEFPITHFIDFKALSYRRIKPLDISAVSFYEIRKVLENAQVHGPNNIVIIMHSFSFVKTNDVQYSKIKPNNIVIGRLNQLCSFLQANYYKIETLTFADYYKKYRNNNPQSKSIDFFPYVGLRGALPRKLTQIINNFI